MSLNKIIHCPHCHRKLCVIRPIHDDEGEAKQIWIKHKGYQILTFAAALNCPVCGSWFYVSGKNGIERKLLNKYFDNGTTAERTTNRA